MMTRHNGNLWLAALESLAFVLNALVLGLYIMTAVTTLVVMFLTSGKALRFYKKIWLAILWSAELVYWVSLLGLLTIYTRLPKETQKKAPQPEVAQITIPEVSTTPVLAEPEAENVEHSPQQDSPKREEELSSISLKELKARARALNVPGCSKYTTSNREELEELVFTAQQELALSKPICVG
jgi:hypothetical protein